MPKFTADTVVSDALQSHPGVSKVLKNYGLMCADCGGAVSESLAQAAQTYGIPLQELLGKLNEVAKSSKK